MSSSVSGSEPQPLQNLYAILEVAANTSTDEIRDRINALYREALANSEHRDIKRRQHYDQLLNQLPHCYNILLDANKRGHYDAYLVGIASGAEDEGFDAYLLNAAGKSALDVRDREGLLEIRDTSPAETAPRPTRSVSRRSTTPTSTSAPASLPEQVAPVQNEVPASETVRGASLLMAIFAGIVVLIVGRGVLKMSLTSAALVALIVMVVAAVAASALIPSRR